MNKKIVLLKISSYRDSRILMNELESKLVANGIEVTSYIRTNCKCEIQTKTVVIRLLTERNAIICHPKCDEAFGFSEFMTEQLRKDYLVDVYSGELIDYVKEQEDSMKNNNELYELCLKYASDQGIATRTYNTFCRYGIDSVEKFKKTPYERFKGFYGIGTTSLKMIKDMKKEVK